MTDAPPHQYALDNICLQGRRCGHSSHGPPEPRSDHLISTPLPKPTTHESIQNMPGSPKRRTGPGVETPTSAHRRVLPHPPYSPTPQPATADRKPTEEGPSSDDARVNFRATLTCTGGATLGRTRRVVVETPTSAHGRGAPSETVCTVSPARPLRLPPRLMTEVHPHDSPQDWSHSVVETPPRLVAEVHRRSASHLSLSRWLRLPPRLVAEVHGI